MIAIKHIQNCYFIGIGGIGMSALARYMKLLGKEVSGYDKTPSAVTSALIEEGIEVSFKDAVDELPYWASDIETTLIVYTPAIPASSLILTHFFTNPFTVVKRAALLGEVSKNSLCLAVAGTHGKTTTSAILGHLLAHCNMPVTAFLGGISENYNSNFISKGTEITVVEADEFDRSFLTLSPDIACITSMDADHLDIYNNAHSLEEAFTEFASLLEDPINLLHKKGLPLNGLTVGVEEPADFEAQNIRIVDGAYVFDLKTPNERIAHLTFHLPGHHNLHNAITALGMAIKAGCPTKLLPEALASFKGVQRRFSYRIRNEHVVLIDDYAHHPTELNALYQAVSEMYPDDKKIIVFQPHLFSRTRDFSLAFAKSLGQFDEVLLLDIYPAREEPIAGVTSEWLLGLIPNHAKKLIKKSEMASELKKSNCRIKLVAGAGDIGAKVTDITKELNDED
ncbi:MAG: UDP-N-acetylmuramate--alanine ligase [Candidatus Latescibacterota bacterium]|jgi:UDP-N-acetylmuramate--alanine ligase